MCGFICISTLLFLLVCTCEGEHARELRGSSSPNVFTVPELRTRLEGGFSRLLAESASNGGARVLSGLHKSLLALTDVGFVDFNHTTIRRESSVFTEDYEDLFNFARFSCRPAAERDGGGEQVREKLEKNQRATGSKARDEPGGVIQTEINLEILFPPHTLGSPGLAHLENRLEALDSFLIFDLHLLADHESFSSGTTCAELVPYNSTSYSVLSFSRAAGATDGGLLLAMTLKPVSITKAHHYMDVS